MQGNSISPIRVLLLDDKPDPFRAIPSPGVPLQASILPTGTLGSRLEVYWVSNPEQARVLLNSLERIFMAKHQALEMVPFPPEVFIFDYAQTQRDKSHIRRPDDPSNPFPILKNALSQCYPGADFGIDETGGLYEGPPPPSDPGSDRFGCFMGGTLARLFHGHPCASVPTTAHPRSPEESVAFFEWFNEQYFHGGFDQKERRTLNWRIIINSAMPVFRKNFVTLAKHGEIEVFPTSLTNLSQFATHPANEDLYLGFRSRFGTRRLSLVSVFCDEVRSLSDEVKAFSKDLADAYVSRQTAHQPRLRASHVDSAANVAAEYDRQSLTDVSIDRYTLSNVVAAILQDRCPTDDARFISLCGNAGLDPDQVLADVKKVEPQPNMKALPLSSGCENPRLAMLFLLVRLSQRSRCNDADSISLLASLSEDEILDGVADRERLVADLGEANVRHLLENHRIPFLDGTGSFSVPFIRDIDYSTLWIAVDPLPRSVLTFENRSRNYGRDTGYLTHAIRRNCDGLVVSSVLDAPRGAVPPDQGGLFPGEGAVLRGYAAEIGFTEEHWPIWLRRAP